MSDDNGGPAIEPVANGGDPVAADPTGGGTLDGVHRTLSTLGMRIDALVTSTTSYRSAITDRLSEYADLVSKLTRAQATDLEEYRHATERTMGELRRGLSSSEETLERVAARIDAMVTDADSTDDQSRRMLAEVRSILEAQESLGRFLTESLDRFGEQVTDRLTASESVAIGQMEAVQTTLGSLQGDIASGEVVAALWDEVRGVRAAIDAGAPAELRGEVVDLAAAVRSLLDSAELVGDTPDGGAGPGIDDVLAEMARLRTDLTEGLVIDTDGVVEPTGVDDVRADIAALAARVQGIADTQADAVAARAATGVDDVRADIAALAARVQGIADIQADAVAARATMEAAPADTARLDAVRDDVADLGRRLDAILEVTSAEPTEDIALRAEVTELNDALRRLLAQAEVVEDEPDTASFMADPGALDQIQASLDELIQRANAAQDAPPVSAAPDVDLSRLDDVHRTMLDIDGRLSTLTTETGAVGAGVRDVIGRLDEGFELTDDVVGPVVPPELADQLATLRDELSVDFESIRQMVAAMEPAPPVAGFAPESGPATDLGPVLDGLDALRGRLEELSSSSRVSWAAEPSDPVDLSPVTGLLDVLRDEIADLPRRIEAAAVAPVESAPSYAQVDPDTVDLLRAEIRSGSSASDELVESLRAELVALRRRIKLRAEGEVLSPEQLTLIAETVAARLGR